MYYSTVFTTVIYAMFTVWIYIKMEINILLILITFTCQFCLISSGIVPLYFRTFDMDNRMIFTLSIIL